jgi:hypothetical protein
MKKVLRNAQVLLKRDRFLAAARGLLGHRDFRPGHPFQRRVPGSRNLRFVLPGSARKSLPVGSSAQLSLSIATKPKNKACSGKGSVATRKLKSTIVNVLSSAQAGVS